MNRFDIITDIRRISRRLNTELTLVTDRNSGEVCNLAAQLQQRLADLQSSLRKADALNSQENL